jgi:hypothetical protein
LDLVDHQMQMDQIVFLDLLLQSEVVAEEVQVMLLGPAGLAAAVPVELVPVLAMETQI